MTSRDAVLRALTTSTPAGLVMDFDGVLSPLVDDPASSTLLPGVDRVLERLAGRLGVVALLSGRPAAFLAERAAVPGVELYGSYGLERVGATGVEVLPGVERWTSAVHDASRALHEALDDAPGVTVEDKSLSVAAHWRRAPDRAAAERLVVATVERLAAGSGLRREPGKLVEELRAPVEHDKGTALRAILASHDLRTVAYAGDDRGDLPAFRVALGAGGHALVVGGVEVAPEVAAVPGTHFTGPDDFASWLHRLDDALT